MGNSEELSKFNQQAMMWTWASFVFGASTVLLAIWCTVWRSYRNKKKSSEANLKLPGISITVKDERSPRLRRGLKHTLDPTGNMDFPGTVRHPQNKSLFQDIQLATDLNLIEKIISSCDSVNETNAKNIFKTDTRKENELLQEKKDIAQSNNISYSSSGSDLLINTAASKECLRMYACNEVVHKNKNMAEINASSANSNSIVNGHRSEDSITDVSRKKHQNIYGLNDVFEGNKGTIRRIRSSLSSSSSINEHRSDDLINNDVYEGHHMAHGNDNVLQEIKGTLQRKASDPSSSCLRDELLSEDLQIPLCSQVNCNVIDSNERFLNIQKIATDVNHVHIIGSGGDDTLKNQEKTVSNIIDLEKRNQAEITANAKDVIGIQPVADVLQVLQKTEKKENVPTNMLHSGRNGPVCKKCDIVDFIELYAPEIRRKQKASKGKRSKKSNRKIRKRK